MKLRKILSSALTAATLLSAAAFPSSAEDGMPFDDVKSSDWFYGAVKFVYDDGIMKGVDSDVFSPSGNLTRAEFVTILCRMSDGKEKITNTFTDVPSGEWYSGYVGWGAEAGVVNGYEDNTFRPNAPMSRQEMAAAMVRYIGARDINLPRENSAPYVFNDDAEIDEWAADYIDVLRISGIVAGDDSVNYNPQDNISRAEAATIIERLYGVVGKAWQGYIPSSDDEKIILGAKYLYWGGTVVAGSLGTDIDSDGAYPSLTAFVPKNVIWETPTIDPDGTVGVSASVAGIDLSVHHVVKICYSYDGCSGTGLPEAVYNVNNSESASHVEEKITATAGENDAGYKTMTFDLSAALNAHPETDFETCLAHVLVKPFSDGYDGDGKFMLRYIGFFKDQAAADSFGSADLDDYLKNYFVYTNINYSKLDSGVEANLDSLLERRIDEILNSKSDVTPEDIAAAGGKCYFVSSVHGSDSNDGTSPDKAWKSLASLYYKRGPVTLSRIKPGDGVFFERGSEFYPEIYKTNTMFTLSTEDGVTYGAYGSGPKPAFYGALDFTDKNDGAGIWLPTEFENIWVLDEIDPDPEWRGRRSEIGNIVFNGGEYLGIRIKSSNEDDPFGPDRSAGVFLTLGYGDRTAEVSNGDEIYEVTERPCGNIGEALTHNFEYMHDYKDGKLYLYFDKDNPGEYFDDIKCSRNSVIVPLAENDLTLDNLAVLCSGLHGMQGGPGNDLRVTNCEIGYIYGCEVETGFEIYGEADNVYIGNCYVHDDGGAVSCQCGGNEPGEIVNIQNIEYADNVITSSVTGAENWNHMGPIDENGYAQNRMINQYVHDNIFAYMGYSRTKVSPPYANGSVVNGSMYGEMENCIFENNTIIYGAGYMYYAYLATDSQPRGWQTRNNTYVFNPDHEVFQLSYETVNYINHYMDKHQRICTPMNYRYLVFYTSNGVDPSGTYYWYDSATEQRIIREHLLNG